MVLTRGRFFTEQDRTRPVAVVTEQTASRLWPEQDPIGQRFARGNSPGRPSQEVVGVVGDARLLGLDVDPVSSRARWSRYRHGPRFGARVRA